MSPKVLVEDRKAAADRSWQEIQQALEGLQYGSVTIIVQDGCVVQVERLEKKRLARSSKC